MSARRIGWLWSTASGLGVMLAVALVWPGTAWAQGGEEVWDDLRRVVLLEDFNTRVVVLGVSVLGLAAGVVGTFMLLRKRALVSEAVSHATLPGICAAFMFMAMMGGTGRNLAGLLLGAAAFGVMGMLAILLIRNYTRLKDDVALGIVLSVFFGLGVAMLGLIQNMEQGYAAGISRFIYGKAASMLTGDAITILIAAAVVVAICAAMFKEFALVCFDQAYAAAQGWPVGRIDVVMMGLAVAVTVIGLQAVGLILVVAMLIIPPAAARFWSDDLLGMTLMAGGMGMVSGYLGATVSGVMPGLPTGPIIVLVATGVFAVSLVAGTKRGLVVRGMQRLGLRRRVGMQHLLRAMYEAQEQRGEASSALTVEALEARRSWSAAQVRRLLRRARQEGWVEPAEDEGWQLTETGQAEAARLVREHRLWEMYLITHAEIAPSHVDRDADHIEHVLGEPMVRELERLLAERDGEQAVPTSPHAIETASSASGVGST